MKSGNVTLAIIKPGFLDKSEEIKKIIRENGFQILLEDNVKLSYESASQFYCVHKERPTFHEFMEYMSSEEIRIMILKKKNAVQDFRTLLGATNPAKAEEGTIRAIFGIDIGKNVAHGSDCDENVQREIDFFSNKFRGFSLIKSLIEKDLNENFIRILSILIKHSEDFTKSVGISIYPKTEQELKKVNLLTREISIGYKQFKKSNLFFETNPLTVYFQKGIYLNNSNVRCFIKNGTLTDLNGKTIASIDEQLFSSLELLNRKEDYAQEILEMNVDQFDF